MGIYSEKPWMKSYFIGPFKLPKTMEPYPEISVYQLLEETAEEFPENIACEYLDQQITYLELKNKVEKRRHGSHNTSYMYRIYNC